MTEIKQKRRLRRTDECVDEPSSSTNMKAPSSSTLSQKTDQLIDRAHVAKSLAPQNQISATNLHRQYVSASIIPKKRTLQELERQHNQDKNNDQQDEDEGQTHNDATYTTQTYNTGKVSGTNSENEEDPYENLPEQESDDFRLNKATNEYHLPDHFTLSSDQYDSLFEHQRLGVQWLYQLYQDRKGGILGDDMGLGKTVQVATLLQGLFSAEMIKRVLIVCPATMKQYWQGELKKWCSVVPEEQIQQFDDVKRNEREIQMRKFKKHGGVLVSSYGQVSSQSDNLSEIRFDILCVDEGHRAKSQQSMLRKDLASLRVKGSRLLLSGTPLQNNLLELWSVFDLVQPKLLGKFEDYEYKFARPIENGLLKDVSQSAQDRSYRLSKELRKIYEPHFLRRTKDQIFSIRIAETSDRPLKMIELPLKTDLVVWLPLSEMQRTLYEFLIAQLSNDALGDTKHAFFLVTYFKKLCLHPHLLINLDLNKKEYLGLLSPSEDIAFQMQKAEEQAQTQQVTMRTRKQKIEDAQKPKVEKPAIVIEQPKPRYRKGESPYEQHGIHKQFSELNKADKHNDFAALVSMSVKIKFTIELLKNLKKEGHRVLVFSMSKKILNLLEKMIQSNQVLDDKVKYMRIDGDTEIATREQICKDFNADPSVFCGLLTTKVGGFGLNLTGADRAIILDPDWNPANDNQAVDRVFRIGQKRDVIVYRLLTAGTIEEKIYRRQVFKKGMNLATIDSSNNTTTNAKAATQADFDKYFSENDIFKLFEYTACNNEQGQNGSKVKCQTLEMLLKRDGFPIEQTPTNVKHVEFLKQLSCVNGLSLNSNLYINKESEEDSSFGNARRKQEPKMFVAPERKPQPQPPVVETASSKRKLKRMDQVGEFGFETQNIPSKLNDFFAESKPQENSNVQFNQIRQHNQIRSYNFNSQVLNSGLNQFSSFEPAETKNVQCVEINEFKHQPKIENSQSQTAVSNVPEKVPVEVKPLVPVTTNNVVTTSVINTTENNTVLFDRFAYKKKSVLPGVMSSSSKQE